MPSSFTGVSYDAHYKNEHLVQWKKMNTKGCLGSAQVLNAATPHVY